MSLLSALYTGVSGLQTFGDSLQVIGDNIANVNTTAFKANRSEFSDMLSQSINAASGRSQMGRGVTLDRVSSNFAQGSFSNTDRLTDLAINGNGFFIVQDANGADYYTRNGQLTINRDGNLVTSGGLKLIGHAYDSNGNVSTILSPLQIQQQSTSPNATGDGSNPPGSGVSLLLNLNASDPVNTTFQVANPASTSNFSTSTTVYDKLGVSHEVGVYFNKTADNTWQWHALVDGGDIKNGTAGKYVECATGTLTYTGSGTLQSATTTSSSFDFNRIDTPQTIGFNFDPASTQFSSANLINSQGQDGYGAGSLTQVAIQDDGTIQGTYSNGKMLPIGQVALANFANLQGLHKSGSGIYEATRDSGDALVGNPAVGGMGSISAFSLELSNVDLATEFVNLISTQRAYQANSKIITVGDQLLADVVQIIR